MGRDRVESKPLKVRILELPAPVRCTCKALLFKAHGPARLEVKCRRCGRLWDLTIA